MGVFRVDMHVHTVLGGDALIRPEEVVGRARQAGLDAVCITEHHSYDLSAPFEAIAERTGFPIFRGVEYSAREGHLLIYGVRAGKGDLPPGLPMQHVIDWVWGLGGAAVAAHPFQRGMVGRALGNDLLQLKNLAAVETMNASLSEAENRRAREAAGRMGLCGIGGSDAHGIQVLGGACTVFPRPVAGGMDLAEALRAGGYYPEEGPAARPRRKATA
jgi:hypothetical protein